jgi:parvulin-like peptidyl-prolyl isomerase
MYLSRENNLLFLSWNNSLACCVFVLSFILLLGCENNSTIATVSNSSISQSEFVNRYEDYLIQTGIKDNILTRKEVLNSMITEVLLENCDDNSNIENKPEYKKESKWIEKQAILGLLKDREVYRNLKVSDEEVREGFLRSNQKIAARHLFAKTEQEINEINQLLNIGVDFNTLAKQTFTDSTLKNNGGYLGYFFMGRYGA